MRAFLFERRDGNAFFLANRRTAQECFSPPTPFEARVVNKHVGEDADENQRDQDIDDGSKNRVLVHNAEIRWSLHPCGWPGDVTHTI